ncbi:MAG: hypothetical protein JNK82_36175 [Myxococcaceae bacterium]|nr:hypothetical protein [Myxococcaceae bacterium]
MTSRRKVVALVFFFAAALLGFIGFTNPRLSELRPVGPIVAVIAALIALTGRPPPKPKTFAPGLGAAHGFSVEDLEANRAGRLTPEQQAYGIALGTTDVRFGSVMLGIGALAELLGLLSAFFPDALKHQDFTFVMPEKLGSALFVGMFLGHIFGGLPLVLGYVVRKQGVRMRDAHRAGTCEAVEGPLEKLVVRGRRTGNTWFYVIANVRLQTNHAAWEKMSGGRYRAYHVPGTFRLLSIEPA